MSLLSGSNQRPADYKSAALPTELRRQFVGVCSSHTLGFPPPVVEDIGFEPMTLWM